MNLTRAVVIVASLASTFAAADPRKSCRPVTAVAAGLDTTWAVADGALFAWGGNTDGIIGTGESNTDFRLEPVPLPKLGSGVSEVSALYPNTCAIKDGGIWCWGINTNGQVGNGQS